MSTEVVTASRANTGIGAVIGDYVKLTKPRVISLLLVTTAMAMFIASEGAPDGMLLLWTMVGGYLAAGGANAINHYVDRDIDGHMKRTDGRPVVAGRVTPVRALVFGISCGVLSAVILGIAANALTAAMGLAGLVVYVGVYTLWLKRSTVHNIVIGGAAGAFPPLVGWAAVTGNLGLYAWLLFAVIFYWTPPHFWALALFREGDYEKAGVPMLPNVAGRAETKKQILFYSLLLVPTAAAPVVTGTAGHLYAAGAVLLTIKFLMDAVAVYRAATREAEDRATKRLFGFSILWLFVLFALILAEKLLGLPAFGGLL